MAENKMGVLPIHRLLISMAVPMMLSMLVQALYNIVDSIYVAQISENALTAVSLAFPFQNLMIAVGVGTGVGVNSLLSRLLGERKPDLAGQTAVNGVFLALCGFLVCTTFGTLVCRPYFAVQVDIPEVLEGGIAYMQICTMFSLGLFLSTMYEKLLAATGKTVLTMYTQLLGAIINIILDPILIFGYFGFPAMGIAGAAAATVIGQHAGAFLGMWLNHSRNTEIAMHYRGFRPSMHLIRKIYSVGFPTIIMQSVGSVMTFGMYQILLPFASTAAAVFGVYFKLQSFVFLPIFGLNNGLVPIVAYNLGAGRADRIMRTFRLALLYASLIMLFGTLMFELFPESLLSMFNPSAQMIQIGDPALRIIAIHFIMAAVGITCSGMFQATGHGVYSLIASLLRQLAVLLPVAWLFSQTGNLNLVWLSFPIAEIVSMLFSLLCMRKIYRQQIVPLAEKQSVRLAEPTSIG